MTSPMPPTETADPATVLIARAVQKLQAAGGPQSLAELLSAVIRATTPGNPAAVDCIHSGKVHAYYLADEILNDRINLPEGTSDEPLVTTAYCLAQADEYLKAAAKKPTGCADDDLGIAKLYLEMACIVQQGAAR